MRNIDFIDETVQKHGSKHCPGLPVTADNIKYNLYFAPLHRILCSTSSRFSLFHLICAFPSDDFLP
jgi:hypothetical protein